MGILAVAGCATGRDYQADIDALNSRVSTLQGQLSAKDEEIARLQNQLGQQQSALAGEESEKRLLREKLDSALSQLEAKANRAKSTKAEESDLK
jgi:chromosome segregation ATPase